MPTELRYAGFWRRALALITDGVILLPIFAVQQAIIGLSIGAAILSHLVIGGVMVAYPVYFHARWGQTAGKMLAKIKVNRLDGTAIGLEGALLRSSVDLALWAIWTGSLVYMLATWSGPEWSSLGFLDRGREIGKRSLANHWSIDWITQAWTWGELLVLLTNKKRRAIHDFIAGSVVIRTEDEPAPAVALTSSGSRGLELRAPGRKLVLAVVLVFVMLVMYQLLFVRLPR